MSAPLTMKIALAGAFVAGATLMVCVAAATPAPSPAVGIPTPAPTAPAAATPAPVVNEDPFDWRDGLVPCETPTGNTMTVACYWDHDGEHYMYTDDGEKFIVDTVTGERDYAEVAEDQWLTAPDGTRHFTDGSWIDADGTHGCTDGMPCSELPPVPAGEPMTADGGYFPTLTLRPCVNEDSTDCYWDAELRGNGVGRSFINVGGVYYYAETTR